MCESRNRVVRDTQTARTKILEAFDSVCEEANLPKLLDRDLPKLFPLVDRLIGELHERKKQESRTEQPKLLQEG